MALVLALPLCAATVANTPPAKPPSDLLAVDSARCSQPNHEATAIKAVSPEYPPGYGNLDRTAVVIIEVAPTGALAESHIFRSSGIAAMDEAALQSARQSTYSPKIVNCTAISGRYIFVARFAPDGTTSETKNLSWHGVSWANPFCSASASLIPWNVARDRDADSSSDEYVLSIWARAEHNYTVRLTMVTADSVYRVELPSVPATQGYKPYLISFDKKIWVEYYFVDGVGIDGQPIVDCPSFVTPTLTASELKVDRLHPSVSQSDRAEARYLQPLPALPCGSVYTPAEEKRSPEPIVGHYGDRPLSADVKVYLDSNGMVVDSEIQRSSGVDTVDEAAFSAVQSATYRPATFLCTPVVSTQRITVQYTP